MAVEPMQNLWGYDIVFPEDVSYSPELLWVKKVAGEKLRLGLSHLAVRAAKRLIAIQIASVKGTQLKKGDKIGSVENTKARWEIKSPVSGEVVAINPEMNGRQAIPLLTKDAYGEGWILELKEVSETESELQHLHKGRTPETEGWLQAQTKALVPLFDADVYAVD